VIAATGAPVAVARLSDVSRCSPSYPKVRTSPPVP
jgi:hypothetical protein